MDQPAPSNPSATTTAQQAPMHPACHVARLLRMMVTNAEAHARGHTQMPYSSAQLNAVRGPLLAIPFFNPPSSSLEELEQRVTTPEIPFRELLVIMARLLSMMILAKSDKVMSDEDKIEFAAVQDLCLSQPFFDRNRAVAAPDSDWDERDEIEAAAS